MEGARKSGNDASLGTETLSLTLASRALGTEGEVRLGILRERSINVYSGKTHHRPQRAFKTTFAVSFRSPGTQQKEDSRDKFQLLLVPEMYKYFHISMTKR